MQKVYKPQKTKKNDDDRSSILFWMLSLFTVLFLFWAPFQKALFNGNSLDFERPIYSTFVWSFIIMVLLSIYLFYKWRPDSHQDVLSVLIWLMPLSFLLAKINEASHYYSTNMLFIQIVYTLFFLIGLYLTRTSRGNALILNAIMISGYVVVWFGMLNWFGFKQSSARLIAWFTDLGNIMEYKDAVMRVEELRLTSVFQYANSYAAYLIALFLGALYLIVHNKSTASRLAHSFMLVPIILSLLLTLSRGALVLLPVILLLMLPLVKLTKQFFVIIYIALSSIICLLVLERLTEIGQEIHIQNLLGNAFTGLGILTGVSLLCAAFIWALHKFIYPKANLWIEKKIHIRFATIILPATALVIGGLAMYILLGTSLASKILPESIAQRIENINFAQHSVLERETFYRDATKLIQDYPWTGAGGGAWAALYEKYQNNPYVSRQAHNFFVQYWVETGFIGLAILLGIFIYIYFIFFKRIVGNNSDEVSSRIVYFIIATSILIHSLIDFDMSYVYLGSLVFLCLGAMIAGQRVELKKINIDFAKSYYWVYPSLLIVLSLILFFNSAQRLNANSQFKQAVSLAQNQKNITEVFVPLNKALSNIPNQPDYAGYKIDILLQAYNQTKDEKYYSEALHLIQQTLLQEPHNRYLIDRQIYALSLKNELVAALEVVNNQIPNFTWDITLYEKSITLAVQLGEKAMNEKNTTQMNQYWDQAFATYAMIQEKQKVLAALPKEQQQGRAFGLTKNMGMALGQISFLRGKYAEAEGFLKTELTDQFDDQLNKQMARWYLAALLKQGKSDQTLFDKLIAKDPKEKDEITVLLNYKLAQ